jgi:hypothetical protein
MSCREYQREKTMNDLKWRVLGLAAFCFSTAACGSAAVSQETVVAAKSSVSAAEAVGAQDEPQASLHLKMAKDDIEYAEQLMDENKNDEARSALERAKYDADLASALTREVRTKEAAEAAATRIQELQKENGDLS